ncbi:MAG TPA: M1 family aminopeptidase [Candidatus Krumholzibacteria bacterium]|nr:M1 family aminopeptidase [Candidatus Krumholzibacteria bacterium]HPD71130.1 M1 family aminopeptidase [Candidatus Krumholzibacteria bacterium]HRY39170.1 M1 family aminopeptidase [Candidatus Krumholzibacteria bacterium]
MRTLLAATLLAAAAARVVWPAPADKFSAAEPWPGRIPAADDRGFDVLQYDLEVDLDIDAGAPVERRLWLDGVMRVILRLAAPLPPEVRLDLVDSLGAIEVRWQDVPTPFVQAGDSLRVATGPGAAAGDTVTVTVTYGGYVQRHGPMSAGLLTRAHAGGRPSVGNVNQPYSSHSWFPCKDHPSDKAALRFAVTVPDTLAAVASGRLLGTEEPAPGRRTWRWATDHPIAPYLVGLAVSDFAVWDEDCDGVPLQYLVFPEHRAAAEAVFAETCAMMRWLGDLCGPYPFADEKYAQAEFVWGGAMENQTATVIGQTVFAQPVRDAQLTVVHELSHHWFGDSLTPRHWRDIWLNEGFARYVELLWLEHTEGPQAYRERLQGLKPADLFQGDGLLGDPDPVLQRLVYDKGAWVLHMLRLYLGDPTFFAFLREYATDPDLAYAHTDRAALTAALGRAAGRDLAPFLAPWLDTEALPAIGARWRAGGGSRTLVEVVQSQGEPFFPLVVPVRVHAGLETRDLLLRMDDLLASAEVTTTMPVDSVVVDPDDLLLRVTAATPQPRLLAAQVRPNPASGATVLAYWLAGADRVAAAVYDVRGRLVRRMDLGAQPATGDGEPRLWVWDGRDEAGRRAAAGVYWLELRTRDDRAARKVTLLR